MIKKEHRNCQYIHQFILNKNNSQYYNNVISVSHSIYSRLLITVLVLLVSARLSAADWLFKNGDSRYQIVVANDASMSEITAAHELQDYIFQISGASLTITNSINSRNKHIYVGYSQKVAALTGEPRPQDDDESFTYCKVGHDLLIWGGKQRGTMYGVFTFLERELGVHWLTPDCTIVPKNERLRLPALNHSENPAIMYRYNNYFVTHNKREWSAHVKENMNGPSTNAFGNMEGFWGSHTMGLLVPVSEFYDSHPEYFSLRDGKRLCRKEQLCLSNPDVLQLCKERLLQVMRDMPGYRIYSLSQNDNDNYCQCEQCVALEKKYGGHSGIILWFVNQVAEEVGKVFPDKYVSTFSYWYSRKPPIGIKPRDNVVIRICSIECCFAHPLTADCPKNKSFMEDLNGWAAIAPHIFIWDYIVDYAQYMAPWPNFQVLAPNIRMFRDHKVIGVFEEAQYQSLGGEFDELKSWTVNQLLWNPDQDTDSLVNIFIEGFYGNAAPQVLNYYYLCKSLVKPDLHFGIFIREDDKIYNDDFLYQAFSILDEAYQKVDDEVYLRRVERVRMQPLYLYCMRHKEQSKQNGKWDELVALIRKYNVRSKQGQTMDEFISTFVQE